ncbi:MAG TPA: NAD(P)-binding domain-containing protein [Terrimesophilobacter sp.]|nr:NAD(P)-binding domain-containing protein [Terrimesophilobacter sp.]
MSTISIVGAGNIARAVATRALAAGYDVQLLVRSRENGGSLAGELGGAVTVDGLGARIAGDLVVLAVPYSAAAEAVNALGNLDGKILVDSTNPINAEFTGLVTAPGTSGAEAIAAVAAGAPVVKAFNSVFAGNILAGGKNGQPLDLLIAGDDADAKAAVTAFGEKTGFRVIDTGALSQSATLEALAFLHMQLQFTRGTNFGSAIAIID